MTTTEHIIKISIYADQNWNTPNAIKDGCIILVLNPFYKIAMDGIPMLRVDYDGNNLAIFNQPCDFFDDTVVNDKNKEADLTPAKLKDLGNQCFSKKQYLKAISYYTNGIKKLTEE